MVTKKTTKKSTKKTTIKKKQQKQPVEEQLAENQASFMKSSIYLSIGIVIILAILVALLFGPKFIQQKKLENDAYNHFTFVKNGEFWFVNIEVNNNPYSILMHYHPDELEDILVEPRAVSVVKNISNMVAYKQKGQVYITMDPQAPAGLAIAGVELAKVLGEKFNIYNIPTQSAFITPMEGYGQQIPIKNCQDSDNETVVIYIREAEDDYVGIPKGYDNCIVLQATDADQTIAVADAYLYHLFGVMV